MSYPIKEAEYTQLPKSPNFYVLNMRHRYWEVNSKYRLYCQQKDNSFKHKCHTVHTLKIPDIYWWSSPSSQEGKLKSDSSNTKFSNTLAASSPSGWKLHWKWGISASEALLSKWRKKSAKLKPKTVSCWSSGLTEVPSFRKASWPTLSYCLLFSSLESTL